MRVKWFGHAAFRVELGGKKFLIDPWISNPKSKFSVEDVYNDVDFIIVTHDHGDHLGDSLEILRKNEKAKLIAIFEIANYVANELGDPQRVVDGNIGGPIDLGDGFTVVLTPAPHSSNRGQPTGAVIIKDSESVYHAGDTGLTYDMKLIGEIYRPKVAMLPIGGHYTMGPVEAAKAVELIKPKYVIPMHYHTFPVIKGDPTKFKELVSKVSPETKVLVLDIGEEVTIE